LNFWPGLRGTIRESLETKKTRKPRNKWERFERSQTCRMTWKTSTVWTRSEITQPKVRMRMGKMFWFGHSDYFGIQNIEFWNQNHLGVTAWRILKYGVLRR
jgi:beta-lactamase class D